jgi:hypothetical protein
MARDQSRDDELFDEKFVLIRRHLGADDNDTVDRMIYNELRGDPSEDAGVLALRIKRKLGATS